MVAEERNALSVQFVDAAGASAAVTHQASLLEHAQVLRNGRAGDGQTGGEFVDRARMGTEHLKDSQASGIAQGGEAVLYVSVHLR